MRQARWWPAVLVALVTATVSVASAAPSALDEHGGPVKGVAVSADGARVLTASFDYSVILWDLRAQEPLAHLYGHDAAVNAVAFLPNDQAISAADDGTLAIWDLANARRIARLSGHQGKVTAVAVAPDGRHVASAGWDRSVRIWDLVTREQILELATPDNVNDVQFSQGGNHLLAATSDGSIQIWRIADGMLQGALSGHDFAATALDVSTDGRLAVSASVDETVQLWDLMQREPTLTLFGHLGPVLAVALSADGRLVASGGVDGTVRVWRRGDGDRLRVYQRHGGPVWSVAFAPDGKSLLSGSADGLVVSYRIDEQPIDSTPLVAEATSPSAAADRSRGAELFRKCVACHTITPDDAHRAGPTLYGLFGRVAGTHPGYRYSPALRTSNLVWNSRTIDRLFDVGPDALVPGSKMPLQRMPDPEDRAELIKYLRQVTAPDGPGQGLH